MPSIDPRLVTPAGAEHPVHQLVSRIAVSPLPVGHPARRHFTVLVEYRGLADDGTLLYAVSNGFEPASVLDHAGNWDWEGVYDDMDDKVVRPDQRFTFDDALDMARRAAPQLRIMGKSYIDAIEGGFT